MANGCNPLDAPPRPSRKGVDMTKGELIRYLQPFDDDIRIVLRGDHGIKHSYDLIPRYLPYTDERPALLALEVKIKAVVKTQ